MPHISRPAWLPRFRRTPGPDKQTKPQQQEEELPHIRTAIAITLTTATLLAVGLLAGALNWIGLPSTFTPNIEAREES